MGSYRLNNYESSKGPGNIHVLSCQNGVIHIGHSIETLEGSHLGSRAKLAQSKDCPQLTPMSLITSLELNNKP